MNLFEFDKEFEGEVIGTDEAGRGPAAGAVFAAAVWFPKISDELKQKLAKLNDSKKLSKKCREELFTIITENAVFDIVYESVEEIEKLNILNASLKAMKVACENVGKQCEKQFITLVDGNKLIKEYTYPQKFVIKGDGKSASIAAASILAKVTRDWYMEGLAKIYPNYGWDRNAGYLTKEHIDAILKYGVTPLHRKKFLRKLFKKEEKQLSLAL